MAELVSRQEIKILIFFILIFSAFGHWIGANESSRLSLARSIVDEGDLDIDEYMAHNPDSIYFEGRYYSDKHPLSSIIIIPGYILAKIIGTSSSSTLELSRFFAVFLGSAIPSSIMMVLIFRRLQQYTEKIDDVTIITLLTGTGTLIFSYSTTFHGIITATALSYGSYYLLTRSRKFIMPAGLLAGFSLSTSFLAIIPISAILTSYALSLTSRPKIKHLDDAKIFLTGLFIGLIPLLAYNYILSGNPLLPPFLLTSAAARAAEANVLFGPQPHILPGKLLRLYIMPYRGLFFWTPLLVPAFIGIYRLRTHNQRDFLAAFFAVTLFTSFVLLYPWWHGGASFGLRYSAIILPFLAVPLLIEYQHLAKDHLKRLAFYMIGTLSVFHTILSVSNWTLTVPLNQQKYYSLKYYLTPYGNPLYSHHLPQVVERGFISPLGRHLAGIQSLDLYLDVEAPGEIILAETSKIVTMNTHSLWLLGGLVLAYALFHREIRSGSKTLSNGIKATALIILILSTSTSSIHYENWHISSPSEDIRWSKERPTIHFTADDISGSALLKLKLRSFHSTRNVTVTINNEVQPPRTVSSDDQTMLIKFNPVDGVNTASFRISKKCTVIGYVAANNDRRCVKIGLESFQVVEPTKNNLFLGKNIHRNSEGKIVVRGTGNLYTTYDGIYTLEFKGKSISGVTTLNLSQNGENILNTKLTGFGHHITTPYFRTESLEPIELQIECDHRCKQMELDYLKIRSYKEQSRDLLYSFGKNWYVKTPSEKFRWALGNSSINIYNYEDSKVNKTMWVRGKSFHIPRNITYILNGDILRTIQVAETNYKKDPNSGEHFQNKYGFNVTLLPGENILQLNSATKCISFGKVNSNDDIRCGVYGLRSLYFTEDWNPER